MVDPSETLAFGLVVDQFVQLSSGKLESLSSFNLIHHFASQYFCVSILFESNNIESVRVHLMQLCGHFNSFALFAHSFHSFASSFNSLFHSFLGNCGLCDICGYSYSSFNLISPFSFISSISSLIVRSSFASCIPLFNSSFIIMPFYSCLLSSFIHFPGSINSSLFNSSFHSSLFGRSFYLTLFNNYLILSLFSSIRIIISSFDVIHSFGFHSLGFKSDAIPGRLNFVSNLFINISGSYMGYCYELCGLGHTSMLSSLHILLSVCNSLGYICNKSGKGLLTLNNFIRSFIRSHSFAHGLDVLPKE